MKLINYIFPLLCIVAIILAQDTTTDTATTATTGAVTTATTGAATTATTGAATIETSATTGSIFTSLTATAAAATTGAVSPPAKKDNRPWYIKLRDLGVINLVFIGIGGVLLLLFIYSCTCFDTRKPPISYDEINTGKFK